MANDEAVKPDISSLLEDDEFEEFTAETWDKDEGKDKVNQWENGWDDDNIDDDFSQQLRVELEKAGLMEL
eukprot:CFRG3497T1